MTLNKAETKALQDAFGVMQEVAKAIRNGTATANHAELLDHHAKQVKTVWTMKGKYDS